MELVRIKASMHPRYSHEVQWKEGGVLRRRLVNGAGAAKEVARQVRDARAHWAAEEVSPTVEEIGAIREARAAGVDLGAAVAAWIKGREESGTARTVAEVVRGRMAAMGRENLSARYVRDVRSMAEALIDALGARLVPSVTSEMLSGVLWAGNPAVETVRSRYRRAHGIFEWARARGMVGRNPMDLIKAPKRQAREEIAILTVSEMRQLLATAEAKDPPVAAVIALGGFAGIRSAELHRLDWGQVKRDAGIIEILAAKSKTRSRRIIRIQPCLASWLQSAPAAGPVWLSNGRKRWESVLRAAGWSGGKRWPANALRHSFASYHLAHFRSAAETALECGHSAEVLFAHYRELVTPVDAADWWEIFAK